MPFFSDSAVKAARRGTSAARQGLSACSGQSLLAVLPSVLTARRMWWVCPCGGVCLRVLFPDALEKRQPVASCCAAGLGFPPKPAVHGLVCHPLGIGAWLASGLDDGVYPPSPPGSFGVLYLWFCEGWESHFKSCCARSLATQSTHRSQSRFCIVGREKVAIPSHETLGEYTKRCSQENARAWGRERELVGELCFMTCTTDRRTCSIPQHSRNIMWMSPGNLESSWRQKTEFSSLSPGIFAVTEWCPHVYTHIRYSLFECFCRDLILFSRWAFPFCSWFGPSPGKQLQYLVWIQRRNVAPLRTVSYDRNVVLTGGAGLKLMPSPVSRWGGPRSLSYGVAPWWYLKGTEQMGGKAACGGHLVKSIPHALLSGISSKIPPMLLIFT